MTAVTVMNWLFPDPLNPPHFLIELGIYVGLGVVWAFPLRAVFRGVGQADPDAAQRKPDEDGAQEKGEDR